MSAVAKWAIVIWCVISALVVVTQVGKPRRPITGGVAAFAVTLCALEIAAIVAYWDAGGTS